MGDGGKPTVRQFSCGPHVGAPTATLDTLRDRATWYLDGCPHLADVESYQRNSLADDAGNDLLAAIRIAEAADAARREAHARLDAAGIPSAAHMACDEATCQTQLGHRVKIALERLADAEAARDAALDEATTARELKAFIGGLEPRP